MQNEQVQALSARLTEMEQRSPDYWTFDGRDQRVGAHSIFHYPAMMVPQMQGAILDLIQDVAPEANSVLDPFVGSGTTLVEAMARGMDFAGVDINPLAVLLSTVKATVIQPQVLELAAARIARRIALDKSNAHYIRFENQKKWFSKSASIALSRIARAICEEGDVRIRRVFWIVLGRIVRVTCNSRTSTYKLHMKADEDLSLSVDAHAHFAIQSNVVVQGLRTHYAMLQQMGALSGEEYSGRVDLDVGDILKKENKNGLGLADIVITSPPYGDNRTTIPYGQYSYLPLMWIPLADIKSGLTNDIVANTHATDSASLGGSKEAALMRGEQACSQYPAYQWTIKQLQDYEDGRKRFASFAADLRRSVAVLASRTKPGGFHVWTVGERRVRGVRVPLAQLLDEMLSSEGIHLIHAASRRIISKRMAARNTLSETMASERVLIARRV